MTRSEAAHVLRAIFAATNGRVDEGKAETWYNAVLSSTTVEEGVLVANDIAGAFDRPPTVKDFRDALAARRRREAMKAQPPALRAGAANPEVARRWLATIKAGLKTIGNGGVPADQRVHHGEKWEACPACRQTAQAVAQQSESDTE